MKLIIEKNRIIMKEKVYKKYAYYYYRFLLSQDSARFEEYHFKCEAISSLIDDKVLISIQDNIVKRYKQLVFKKMNIICF